MGVPIAAMERILKEVGTTRVSLSASKSLKEAVEEYAREVGARALKLAQHAGRVTVTEADVKLAIKG